MEKMRERKRRRRKKRDRSLRQTLFYSIPVCAFLAFLGTMAIGHGTNSLQGWYESTYMRDEVVRIWDDGYEFFVDRDGVAHYSYVGEEVPTYDAEQISLTERITYGIINDAQVVLIPLWVLVCVWMTVWIFYKREMEKPLRVLQDASEKIADNCLNFELEPVKDNELGRLRDGFEKMRAALYENNRAMWQQVEERKRLNAAFAHDMRTPITVLKGYGEMLERYVPEGRISQDKLMEILGMMNGQIRRLENYTQKMSSIRKLEDLEPEVAPLKAAALDEKLRSMCEILGQEILYSFSGEGILGLDEALVLEVCENLISNGLRYARQRLQVTVWVAEGELPGSEEELERYLEVAVEDDGPGFSPEDLQHATDPFYRGEGQMEQSHFGLGLYICRLICAKCGGSLTLSNGICGGRVTARFQIFPESR
ncbi:MAG: HAMP domain-containing histidine kinase [Acetatifactor sp.]|nr:HAMP domain-containing histidine kinase [Acetatifactor sp.]